MNRPSFHPVAWLAWSVASIVLVMVLDTPVASLTAVAAATVVAARFAARGPEGRTVRVMLRVGIGIIAVRIVLFGLTGHTGETIVATLPSIELPRILGGMQLGGAITGEVLAHEAAEGLRIAAVLVCGGVFLSVVPTYAMLRMMPRFLFEAGLVVGIALSFVPVLLQSAQDVRDAQRLRGHRFRGLRSLRPLVAPVLSSAIERALSLAGSMEARGYGRAANPVPAAARVASLAGLLCIAVGGGLLLFGRGLTGGSVLVAGMVAAVAGARGAGRAVVRSRMPKDGAGPWDIAFVVAALVPAVAAIGLADTSGAQWYAYPSVTWPRVDPFVVFAAATLVVPVPLASLRSARVRRFGATTLPEAAR